MNSQTNTSQLAQILFKNKVSGYSIRINSFNKWLKSHGESYESVAKELGMSEKSLKEKITKKQQLDQNKILKLIEYMGDKEAFYVLYFETFAKRDRIYKQLFKHKEVEEINEGL